MGAYAILLNTIGQTQRAEAYMNQARVYGMYPLILFFIFPMSAFFFI